ncbi:MAG TPA: hypothetical protein VJS45_09275, partial [Acidimicrobiia bacterium]|nr:hypothetical protein [Acidimicrobiia bacterium]
VSVPAVAGDTAAADPAAGPEAPTGGLLPRTGAGLLGQFALAVTALAAGLLMRALGRRRGRTQPAG